MFLLFERIPHKNSSIFFYFVHLNVQNFRHILNGQMLQNFKKAHEVIKKGNDFTLLVYWVKNPWRFLIQLSPIKIASLSSE